MFDIGWSELLVIAVVALIAIGPKELPGVLRNVGHWMGKVRRMAADFQSQFQEAMREAEMEDLKKHADDLNSAARALSKPFDPTDYLGKLDTPSTAADTPATTAEAPAAAPEAVGACAAADATSVSAEPPAAQAPAGDAAAADALPAAERETTAPAPGSTPSGDRSA
jgi:sec-independent protein translocase protein TatB